MGKPVVQHPALRGRGIEVVDDVGGVEVTDGGRPGRFLRNPRRFENERRPMTRSSLAGGLAGGQRGLGRPAAPAVDVPSAGFDPLDLAVQPRCGSKPRATASAASAAGRPRRRARARVACAAVQRDRRRRGACGRWRPRLAHAMANAAKASAQPEAPAPATSEGTTPQHRHPDQRRHEGRRPGAPPATNAALRDLPRSQPARFERRRRAPGQRPTAVAAAGRGSSLGTRAAAHLALAVVCLWRVERHHGHAGVARELVEGRQVLAPDSV